MTELFLIVGIIAVIVLALGFIVLFISMKKKKEGKYEEPDYRAFFTLGICFLSIGIVFMITIRNPGFLGISGLGIIYMLIGLSHREKWKET
jgi:uncharacterized protein with PQ loop repeat